MSPQEGWNIMRNPYDMIGRLGLLLAIAGAINWLLVGLFQWNFVQWVFGDSATQTATTGERIVYVVVGVGGLLAVPMLAATLARSRSRDIEYEERDRISGDRDRETGYAAAATTADREAERSVQQPVRKTERVIYRTEEPISVPSDEASASSTDRPAEATDTSLRYGTVEETDEGFDEGADEQRRAA
jgi:uncharacterized protein